MKLNKRQKIILDIEFAVIILVCALFLFKKSCSRREFSELNQTEQEQLQEPLTRSGSERLAWDYPVRPGMEEWRQFTTGRQRWEACQIPQNVIDALNTEELAKICMDFPLFFEYAFSDDERMAINFMIENFNGLKELSKRKDGAMELINIYKTYPILTQIQDEASKDYHTPYKLPFLELLLSDNAFIKQLDDRMFDELEKIVLEKYVGKLENSHVYSLYNINNTFLLGAVVIVNRNSAKTPAQQETARRFIDNYGRYDTELLTEISRVISGL